MALHQTFPKFQCDRVNIGQLMDVDQSEAFVVPYKRNGNASRVLSAVYSRRHVRLDAAPASGKTTVLPKLLAETSGELVVLVLPFHQLAVVVYDYLRKCVDTVGVELMDAVGFSYPKAGVVVTFAGCLVARWLQEGRVTMPRCYLLHDESHESGAATAAVRAFSPTAEGVLSYVEMSATAGAGEARKMEAPGNLSMRSYVGEQFADPWSVEEAGAPWSVPKMNGNVLIFEDDNARAEKLIQAYSMCGVPCFRWTSRIKVEVLQADLKLIDSTPNRHYVILADSSFRSGYTLPVTTIVDTGKVHRVVVDEAGRPVKSAREIYENEAYQSACRGGRMVGLSTVYWRPLLALKQRRAVLEQTDAEAFAMISAILGYEIAEELKATRAARGYIPRDVFGALDGDMPIACIPDTHVVHISGFNSLKVKVEPVEVLSEDETICVEEEKEAEFNWVDQMRESLQSFSMNDSGAEDWVEPTFGEYITALDLLDVRKVAGIFPNKATSVMKALAVADSDYIVSTWDDVTKSEAIKHLLESYNILVIQMHGATLALNEAKARRSEKNTHLVCKWASSLAEVMSQITVEAQKTFVYVCKLSKHFVVLEDGQLDMRDQEALCMNQFLKGFKAIPNSVRSSPPSLGSTHTRSISGSSCSSSSSGSSSSKKFKQIDYPTGLKLRAWVVGQPAEVYDRRMKLKIKEQKAIKAYLENNPVK